MHPTRPACYQVHQCIACEFTSKASKLMKLAIAKPSMRSSSHDIDSLFLRRGGLCLPNPGRHSRPPAPRTEFVPQASRSEPEDRDVARCSARSTLLLCRSLSRWERDRRLCLKPLLRLGPSMLKPTLYFQSVRRHLISSPGPVKGTKPQMNHHHTGPPRSLCLKWRL